MEGALTKETIPESAWLIYPGSEKQVGFKQTAPQQCLLREKVAKTFFQILC